MGSLQPLTPPAPASTALSNLIWTNTRAAYLDNLIAVVTTGTFTLQNNILEQDLIIFTAATQYIDITLFLNNLTQTATVREYEGDLTDTFKQLSAKVFPADFDTGTQSVVLSFKQKNARYKITIQSSVLEGATRDIPYRYATQDLA